MDNGQDGADPGRAIFDGNKEARVCSVASSSRCADERTALQLFLMLHRLHELPPADATLRQFAQSCATRSGTAGAPDGGEETVP